MFGPLHLSLLALTLLLPLIMIGINKVTLGQADGVMRLVLAVVLAASEPVYQMLIFSAGESTLERALPMHLCDWAMVSTVIALLTRWQLAYDLSYFWALSGTLQATLTPDLSFDHVDGVFAMFFVQHISIVAGALYLTFGTKLRPTWCSYGRAILATSVFFFVNIGVNTALGTNFGYLHHRPERGSLLDIMPDNWYFYAGSLYGFGVVFLFVLYLPWVVYDAFRPAKAVAASN